MFEGEPITSIPPPYLTSEQLRRLPNTLPSSLGGVRKGQNSAVILIIISKAHIDLVLYGFCTSSHLGQENVNVLIQQLHSEHLLNARH